MATFVAFIDAPVWEVHYDPEHGSYHFEGRCAIRVFMFVERPFAYLVPNYRFTPTSPYGDDLIFERTRPRDEQSRRARAAASAVRGQPLYEPRSPRSETDPSEDSPTHIYSEGSAPAPPPPRRRAGSEATVTQPQRVRSPLRWPTPEELEQFAGYLPPSPEDRRHQ